MKHQPNHHMPPCGCPPMQPFVVGEINYSAEQINQLLALIPLKMDRKELHGLISYTSDNYIGHVPDTTSLKPQKAFAWAFVGELSGASPYFHYTPDFIPEGLEEGWNDMSSFFGKYNMTPSKKEDTISAEELFAGYFRLPTLTADKAIADEHGNRITDTYVTRKAVANHIKQIYNQQFLENPPLITEGYITPGMLSEETKQMLEATGQSITNLPDGEDLKTEHGVLKLADKQYNPVAYSGLGRRILRKNIVAGVNLLTQAMVSKPNTIYVIQYDYDLQGAEITIPEGCVLKFEGGGLNNGSVKFSQTTLLGKPKFVGISPSGKITNTSLDIANFGVYTNMNDCSDNIQYAIDFASSIKGLTLKFGGGYYKISKTIYLKDYVTLEGVDRGISYILANPDLTEGYMIDMGQIVRGGLKSIGVYGNGTSNGNLSGVKIGVKNPTQGVVTWTCPLFNCEISALSNNGVECYKHHWVYFICNCNIINCKNAALYDEGNDNFFDNLWLSGSSYGLKTYGGGNCKYSNIKIDNIEKHEGVEFSCGAYLDTCTVAYFNNIDIDDCKEGYFQAFNCSQLYLSNMECCVSKVENWNELVGNKFSVFYFNQSRRCRGTIGIHFYSDADRVDYVNLYYSTYINLSVSYNKNNVERKVKNTGSSYCSVNDYTTEVNNMYNQLVLGNLPIKNLIPSNPALTSSSASVERPSIGSIKVSSEANGYVSLSIPGELIEGHKYLFAIKATSDSVITCNLFSGGTSLIYAQHGGSTLTGTFRFLELQATSNKNNLSLRVSTSKAFTYILDRLYLIDITGLESYINIDKIKEYIEKSYYVNNEDFNIVDIFNKRNIGKAYISDSVYFLEKGTPNSLSYKNTHFIISEECDLKGGRYSIGANSTLEFIGNGKIVNGTISLNGAKILPSYNSMVEPTLTINGMPSVGTFYFNGKPTWSNGTNWVDANGVEV